MSLTINPRLKGGLIMAKKKFDFIALVLWLVGIIVSLTIGFSMVGGTLSIPNIPSMVTIVTGWIVVGLTALGGIMSAIKNLS